jgi:hypothetical protein
LHDEGADDEEIGRHERMTNGGELTRIQAEWAANDHEWGASRIGCHSRRKMGLCTPDG